MTIRSDFWAYLADYTGYIQWNTFTEAYTNTVRPTVKIPLYITQATIPIRKPKVTEISTVPTTDPGTQASTTTNCLFFGAPDILQTELTGFTVTPTANKQWAPVDISGAALNYGQLSYNDIISYYIRGRFNRSISGAWQRQDPDLYVTPRGQLYINPVIAIYQPQASVVMKKQAFEMTLFLET